jgi:hypothetical protein
VTETATGGAAAALLARVRQTRPMVADLAGVLALCASIDVAVARRLRRALLPAAGAATEAELWSSPLVQLRGSGEMRLRADVQERLWLALQHPAPDSATPALRRIWAELDRARDGARPLLRLEERLTYLGLAGDAAAIDEALGTVVRAMLEEPERRRDLAAWAGRALARLPAPVRAAESAKVLAAAARGWVATAASLATLAPQLENLALAEQLGRGVARDERVELCIRRVGDHLEIGGAPPRPYVVIESPAGAATIGIDEDQTYALDPAGVTRIPVHRPEVMIRTADGRRWLVGPEVPRPDLDAIVPLHGRGGLGAAYLVAPTLLVSSARLLASASPTQQVTFGTIAIDATIAAIDEDADIALLRLARPAPATPLALDPDVRQGEAWQAYPLPAGAASESGRLPPGDRSGGWAGTVATAWPGITLATPYDEIPERLTRPGMPIFCGQKVIGHLRGDPQRGGRLHTTSARLIAWWLAQVEAPPEQSGGPDYASNAPPDIRPSETPVELPLSRQVFIHLPERISTGGLLGTRLSQEGSLRRFRRHRWGVHQVAIVSPNESIEIPDDALEVRVHSNERGIDDSPISIEVGTAEAQAISDACLAAALQLNMQPVTHRSTQARGVHLGVRRLPGLSEAWAYRRAVRFVTQLLSELDGASASATTLHIHIPGIGAVDLLDAQRRYRDPDMDLQVLAIDPETDLMEVRAALGNPNRGDRTLQSLSEALGGRLIDAYKPDATLGPLRAQFGISSTRGGRELRAGQAEEGRAILTVRSLDDRPLRGYVTFYVPSEQADVHAIRVRARDGVAICDLSLPGIHTVGAIVEEEGLELESAVGEPAPPEPEPERKSEPEPPPISSTPTPNAPRKQAAKKRPTANAPTKKRTPPPPTKKGTKK